jgi:hypothetical protein
MLNSGCSINMLFNIKDTHKDHGESLILGIFVVIFTPQSRRTCVWQLIGSYVCMYVGVREILLHAHMDTLDRLGWKRGATTTLGSHAINPARTTDTSAWFHTLCHALFEIQLTRKCTVAACFQITSTIEKVRERQINNTYEYACMPFFYAIQVRT